MYEIIIDSQNVEHQIQSQSLDMELAPLLLSSVDSSLQVFEVKSPFLIS